MKKAPTLFFDLGNVLVFFDHKKMIRQLATCSGLAKELLEKELFEDRIFAKYEKGQISTNDLYHYFHKMSPQSFSLSSWVQALTDIFTPHYELLDYLSCLKKEKIRLILLSNTNEAHFCHILSLTPIFSLFDALILSYEVGVCKPDPRIFQKALECVPIGGKSFYTDDVPEFVETARSLGLDGEVFSGILPLKTHLIQRSFVVETT